MRRVVHNPSNGTEVTDEAGATDVGKLRGRLGSMERELAELHQLVSSAIGSGGGSGGGEPSVQAVQDERWICKKCGGLLGYYDRENDVLRIGYKELTVFVRTGGADIDRIVGELVDALSLTSADTPVGFHALAAQAIDEHSSGGFIQVICRLCKEPNSENYASEATVIETREAAAAR